MRFISLIHPSRGRAQKSYTNTMEWISKSGCYVEVLVRIDKSDPSSGDYYKAYGGSVFQWGRISMDDNQSVVEATNIGAKASAGDILVYLSDDFKCPDNWGQLIIKEFDKYSGQPIVLKVDDCLQRFDIAVLTIPIMNRLAYEGLGYFFHPDFKSMHVDEHLYWRSKKLGFLRFAPNLKFPHDHYSIGKAEVDETYRRSEANWDHGKNTLEIHKREGFIR